MTWSFRRRRTVGGWTGGSAPRWPWLSTRCSPARSGVQPAPQSGQGPRSSRGGRSASAEEGPEDVNQPVLVNMEGDLVGGPLDLIGRIAHRDATCRPLQ